MPKCISTPNPETLIRIRIGLQETTLMGDHIIGCQRLYCAVLPHSWNCDVRQLTMYDLTELIDRKTDCDWGAFS